MQQEKMNHEEWGFLPLLTAPLHEKAPLHFGKGKKGEADIMLSGVYLAPAPAFRNEENLEEAYKDFESFLKMCGMAGADYPLCIEKAETDCFEAYSISTDENGITVSANDTEGVRRALIHIEDTILQNGGPFMKKGSVTRKPHIKTRITRGFFSPTNRPPNSVDELLNDIDYYPDNYLLRLMHDGANGLWIYTRFSDLLPSSYITEYGQESEKRIEKLRKIIRKCARFGIRVYIFAIEPYFFKFYPGLSEKYKDALGMEIEGGYHALCTKTEFVKGYLREAGEKLTTLLPDLGGWIAITAGEGLTNCVSNTIKTPCPRCGNTHIGETLSEAVEAMTAGFRKTNGPFDFISWTYDHRSWDFDDIREYVRAFPEGAIMMQNFDDMVVEEQLGKKRVGVDYWLSAIGPSDMFRITAEEAQKTGKRMYAKMQVCCSHEVASVPYVPVPGILFKKYKAAKALGVSGVVQCWYFGNYPSMMSKAAGMLAFLEDFEDEDAFLRALAALYFGREKAAIVSEAWKQFEAGYRQYPLNIMFSYYGPMHDSVVRHLALEPKNLSLERTWMGNEVSAGDRIGECMLEMHEPEEIIALTDGMCRAWNKGLAWLKEAAGNAPRENEIYRVAEALGLLFESGNAICKFYSYREALGLEKGDPIQLLSAMREITEAEIERSEAMLALCLADKRLGYHSEAESYKISAEKLATRIADCRRVLETEFPRVLGRIESGKAPLPYYKGEEKGVKSYSLCADEAQAKWEKIGTHSEFCAFLDADHLHILLRTDVPVKICPEFRLMHPAPSVKITPEGEKMIASSKEHWAIFGEKEEAILSRWQVSRQGDAVKITLRRSEIGLLADAPFKMRLANTLGESWCKATNEPGTLGKAEVLPKEYGWWKPKMKGEQHA